MYICICEDCALPPSQQELGYNTYTLIKDVPLHVNGTN